MNKFAKDGASLVPMAVPPTCKYSLLSNKKLLVVRTSSNNLQREAFVGFCFWFIYIDFELHPRTAGH